jgi:WD40 repeat protein
MRTVPIFGLFGLFGLLAFFVLGSPPDAHAQAPAGAGPRLHVQIGHTSQTTFMFPTAAAYSADDRFLVTGSADKTARLWDAATGTELQAFSDGVEAINFVAVAAGARYVATANANGTLRVWDGRTGAELRKYSNTWEAAFSADGQRLFVPRGQGTSEVIPATGTLLRTIGAARANLHTTNDGMLLLATDQDGFVRAWNAITLEPAWTSTVKVPERGVAFAANGRSAALLESDTVVTLVELPSGRTIARFGGHPETITSFAISANGSRVLTATDRPDGRMRLFEAGRAGEAARVYEYGYEVFGLAFAPGRDSFLALQRTGEILLRRIEDGLILRSYEGLVDIAWPASYSTTGRYIVDQGGNSIRIWDVETGTVVNRITAEGEALLPAVLTTSDGRVALVESEDAPPQLRAPPAASELNAGSNAQYSSDLASAVSESEEPGGRSMIVWDVATGKPRGRIPGTRAVFAGDGSMLAVQNGWRLELRDPVTLARLHSLLVREDLAAVGPDGGQVALESSTALAVVDVSTGRTVRRLAHRRGDLTHIRFSPNGARLLVAGTDGVVVWEVASGRQVLRLAREAHYATVDASFSRDGRHILTGGAGPARIIDAETGSEICTLVDFKDGNWAVVEPGGRFDTNALDGTRGLSWFVDDDPFTPLPVEVFMRDMYEPRLLPRLLSDKALPPVRDLTSLNRVQPEIEIIEVTPRGDGGDRVNVRVRVSAPTRLFGAGSAAAVRRSTAIHDVRLFRDGQLVGSAPAAGGVVALDGLSGAAIVEFDVRLPRLGRKRMVEFTAHAFNDDRVKSATARRTYEAWAAKAPVSGRAYLIGIGVNDYGIRGVDLRFAVNDAREFTKLAGDGLAATGQFEEVVSVRLVAEQRAPSSGTKAAIRAVFDVLASRTADPTALATIAGAERLRQVEPEDVVIVSFSGHGFADPGGAFYLVPSDALERRAAETGANARDAERQLELAASDPTARLRDRCVSSDELAEWLRDIDAGELVLVVDACQSAASVESEGFKPGPMGSRGLGQLAYDKGMRILAATQADNVAIEGRGLEHGLLSYALVVEGLGGHRADSRPADGRVEMVEWLTYGATRVPAIAATGGGARLLVHGQAAPAVSATAVVRRIQRPALFDFSRSRQPVTISVRPRP